MTRRVVGLALDIALIGLVAAVVVTAAVGPFAAATGRRALVVGGGSMSPTIPIGSMVIVEPAGAAPLRAGDIATFSTLARVVVTHRVTRVIDRADGTWYETKGDANAHPDPALWPEAAVVGRVVVHLPALGMLSWLLRHPIGWLNVIVLAGWLILARRLVEPVMAAPLIPLPATAETPGPASDAASTARGVAT